MHALVQGAQHGGAQFTVVVCEGAEEVFTGRSEELHGMPRGSLRASRFALVLLRRIWAGGYYDRQIQSSAEITICLRLASPVS